MTRDRMIDALVFTLFVALGVIGRLGQPVWHFTPTAAIAVFAGFYFRTPAVAAAVPIGILFISNRYLPAHDNVVVFGSVLALFIVPIWLGRWIRRTGSWKRVAAVTISGLIPSTLFYLVSDFAVWSQTHLYEHNVDGLAKCYIAALPFYRVMLYGDLFYGMLFVAALCCPWALLFKATRRNTAPAVTWSSTGLMAS